MVKPSTTSNTASNSRRLRHYNELVVLDHVRQYGAASKAEISRGVHLSAPAVAAIVQTLVENGYLTEKGKRYGQRGQPSELYATAGDAAFAIGLHIGRKSIDAVLLALSGETVDFQSVDYDFPDPQNVRHRGNQLLAKLLKVVGPERLDRVTGVGIAAPYFLAAWHEELGFPEDVREGWMSTNLSRGFFDVGALPLLLENDASSAALAELHLGRATTARDFLHISLGTFIGGGLVLDGVLQTGPNGNTAALGPFPVTASRLNSVPKPRNGFDILLHRASVFTLTNHMRFNGHAITRAAELEHLPAAALPNIEEWQDDCADALAQALVGALAIVDVEAVVIDGILPPSIHKQTVDKVRRRFHDIVPAGLITPNILTGTLGRKAFASGAALLPMMSIFSPDRKVLTKAPRDKKPLMVRRAS